MNRIEYTEIISYSKYSKYLNNANLFYRIEFNIIVA